MIKLICFGIILTLGTQLNAQFAAVVENGSFERLKNDSAILLAPPTLRGEIQWQKSTDNETWIDIDSPRFVPQETAHYRLKVTEGECNPVFSQTVQVYSKNTRIEDYLLQGITVRNIINSGVTVSEMLNANISVQELIAQGIPAVDLYEAGAVVPGFSCDSTLSYGNDWRAEANNRINKFRKNNLTVKVIDIDGNVLQNVKVEIKLKRHKFIWGAVVNDQFLVSPYSDNYKEIFLSYFNGSGFSLSLKPKWPGTETERLASEAIKWFRENNIFMRGHALIWEGEKNLHKDLKTVYQNNTIPDKIKGDSLVAMATTFFHHALQKWDVDCWDVINEPITNHLINDLVDMNTFTYWFKLADSLRKVYMRPDVKLFLNEYQIVSAIQKWALTRPEKYKAIIDQLISEGAPIEGIGFQSRIKNGLLSPEVAYQRLRDFEKYNLPYHATEFEIRDSDNYQYSDAQKKQIVNEMMTIYFSHPNTEGFWHWTFFDKQDQSSPWALFKFDGSPYPCGEEWMRTMDEDFNTNVTLFSGEDGTCCVRGYKGDYDITITSESASITESIVLDKNELYVIQLDE